MANIPDPPALTGSTTRDLSKLQLYIRDLAQAVRLGLPESTASFTIAGTASIVSVPLDAERADTDYTVVPMPTSFTGAPAAGAFIIEGIDRATDGFTLTVTAAPGANASVTFSALIIPNPT